MRWLFGRQILGAKAPSGLHQKSNESKKAANDRIDMSLNRIYGDFVFLKDDAERRLKSFQDCGGQIIKEENTVTYKLNQAYLTKILNDSGKTERFVYCTSDYSEEGEKVQEAAIADSDVAAHAYFRDEAFKLMLNFEKYRPEIGMWMDCAR